MNTRDQIILPENDILSKYDSHTDLILAIRFSKLENNLDIAKSLLENYENINFIDKNGKTLLINVLMLPIEHINMDIIKLIIDKGSHLDKIPNPFIFAIDVLKKSIDIELLNKLFETSKNWNSNVPLILAARKNNIEIVKYLLVKGANINLQECNGDTLLIVAAEQNNYEILKIALEYKPNLDLLDMIGESALHYIVKNNNIEYLEILLKEGAKMHTDRCSPFRRAISNDIYNDKTTLTKIFFEHGAKITMLEKNGVDKLRDVIDKKNFDLCNLLINNGVDVSEKIKSNDNEVSLLMYAFMKSKNDDLLEIIKLMITKVGHFNKENALKNTDASNKQLIEMLKQNNELLLKAIKLKNINMIKLLLEKGKFDNTIFIEIIALNDKNLIKLCCDNIKLDVKRDDILNKLVDYNIDYDILNFIYEKLK